MSPRQSLERDLRREIEHGNLDVAAEIAAKLSHLLGEPRDDDRYPPPTDCWGCEA